MKAVWTHRPAMASPLTIINPALTRVGHNTISSLTSSDIAAQIANVNYEPLVESRLSVYPWKRGSNAQQMSRLDPDVVGEPPEPWTAAYQIPTDVLEIRTVKVSGLVIEYEVHGDTILCDADESSEVILHHVWRADENDWPPWFREGMVIELEALFLRGIGERYREAELRQAAAVEWWRLAKNRDSQSQTARAPMGSPALVARRGG